jgi:Ca-activated chloride channel homolog
MVSRIVVIILTLFLAASGLKAESYASKVKKGNEALKTGDTKTALDYYHNAETDLPESPELSYNIAGALYQQKGYEEAVQQFEKSLKTTDIKVEASANYNLGNTYFRMGDYEKAIGSFENALKGNPKDMDAKFNLELARKMLKEQTKPQQGDDPNQPGKPDKQDDRQQNRNQQDQQQQDQNQQEQNQQSEPQQQDKNQQDQQKQGQAKDQKMSKEDAERILNALRDDEQKLQKQAKREVVKGDYNGRDW